MTFEYQITTLREENPENIPPEIVLFKEIRTLTGPEEVRNARVLENCATLHRYVLVKRGDVRGIRTKRDVRGRIKTELILYN